MSGIFVVEGPDGTGKTTLANELKGAGHVLHARYRFPQKMHQYHWALLSRALKKNKDFMPNYNVVIDRLWISELIYGAVYRNGEYTADYFDTMDRALRILNIPTVFCLPKDPEAYFERYTALCRERDEMYQMDDKFKQLTYAYINLFNEMKHRPDVFLYTEDNWEDMKKYVKWLRYSQFQLRTTMRPRRVNYANFS